MCYVPFVAFFLFFAEKQKTEEYKKHMIYWMLLTGSFIVLCILLKGIFIWFVVLLYIWASAFMWYKAYSWENVDVKFVDDFVDKNMKKTEEKKEKEGEEVEDILK
jgi:hypothetical protein